MKKLFGIIPAVCALLLAVLLASPPPAHAVDVRTGNNIVLSQNHTNLKDLYLFGRSIDLSAPVTNDVVAAGGNVTISGTISNDLAAAGGTVIINGKTGNTARVAGGNVTIDGPVTNDLVVAGGSVTVSKHAAVGADLLAAGGQVVLNGPVKGNMLMSGGDITINSSVGGNVTIGQADMVTLGPHAKITGTLTYNAPQPLTKDPGSVVTGHITYHHVQKQPHKQQSAQLVFGFSIYQLLVEILLSILLIYFARNGMMAILLRMQDAPLKSLGIGLVYVLLAPVVSIILLILFPLGIVSFLLYISILILSIFIRDIFAGWLIMNWWDKRNKKHYLLDWKAGVIGPVIMLLINLIPVLGWLISALICLSGAGALLAKLTVLTQQLQTATKKK